MKYIVYTILKLLFILLIIVWYAFSQFFYILWHLKPNNSLLEEMMGDRFYCKTHRTYFQTNWFQHDRMFKVSVVPKSLFQFILWEIKYYNNHEILEITKREEELYKEFCKVNRPRLDV